MLPKSKLNSVESTISKFGKTILEKKICHQTVSYVSYVKKLKFTKNQESSGSLSSLRPVSKMLL